MAKGKSNSAAKLQSTSPTKRKSPSSQDGRPTSSATAVATSSQRAISNDEIGHVAGEVWGLLSNNGEQTLAAIKKSVDAPPDIVLAAVGWLAREDKLDFSAGGRVVKVSLR